MKSRLVSIQPDKEGTPQGMMAQLTFTPLHQLVVLLLTEYGREGVHVLLVLVHQTLLLLLVLLVLGWLDIRVNQILVHTLLVLLAHVVVLNLLARLRVRIVRDKTRCPRKPSIDQLEKRRRLSCLIQLVLELLFSEDVVIWQLVVLDSVILPKTKDKSFRSIKVNVMFDL